MNKLKHNKIFIWICQLLPLIIFGILFIASVESIPKLPSIIIGVFLSAYIAFVITLIILSIFNVDALIVGFPIKSKLIKTKYGNFLLYKCGVDEDINGLYIVNNLYENKYLLWLSQINNDRYIRFYGEEKAMKKAIDEELKQKYETRLKKENRKKYIKNLKKSIQDWSGINDKETQRIENLNNILEDE